MSDRGGKPDDRYTGTPDVSVSGRKLVMIGLAYECSRARGDEISVRQELTPEDAEDLIRYLQRGIDAVRARNKS